MTAESDSVREHRAQSPVAVRCAVMTVSDTRTLADDLGGQSVVDRLVGAGHEVVARVIVPDEPGRMKPQLEAWRDDAGIDAVLITGGTGIASRDLTYETVSQLLDKPLTGYGELFRWLSFQEIGAAAMLSRATGGLMGRTVLMTMPGSPKAVRLAMERLILPELGHLVREARR